MTGDAGNAVELEEAFGELADRLAGMFAAGSQRDRVVVRSIIEEGLKINAHVRAPYASSFAHCNKRLNPPIS
jgi:hypothetical protein